jgi:type III secretion protein T
MMFFEYSPLLTKLAITYARVAPVFFLMPFLNGNLLGSPVLKNVLIFLVALGLSPVLPEQAIKPGWIETLAMSLGEGLIGLCVGLLLVVPIWLAHGVGSIIDNQRGATLSNSMDPVNGVETSELANLFNLFSAVIFLQGGGLLLILEALTASYRLYPPGGTLTLNFPLLLGYLDDLVGRALVLAAPVIACLFLTEVLLGLLSRFSQQLNAFSVAMTVKSAVAFIVLLMYFPPVLRDRVLQGWDPVSFLNLLRAGS